MYGKPPLGAVLPMAGLTATAQVIPGLPYAQGLQEAAGAGFLLYAATAIAMLSLKLWFHLRNSGEPS